MLIQFAVLGSASLYLTSAIPQLKFEFLNPLPQVKILEVHNRNSASAKFESPQLKIRNFQNFGNPQVS